MTIKKIIAIASAKGGVGKSSITAALALNMSKSFKVGVLDADIYGPNQHILFDLIDAKPNLISVGDKKMYFYNGSAWVEMDGSGSGVISLTPTDGTFIDITQNSTSGAITTTADLSATGTPSATKFLRGDNVWATPAGAYTSWSLEADSGSAVDITDGLRVDFTGGTGISTAVASATPNTLTITNTGVTSIVAGSNISISGSTGAVTISATGDVTGIDAGDGIRIDDGATATPEVNVEYSGSNNVIVKAPGAEGTAINTPFV